MKSCIVEHARKGCQMVHLHTKNPEFWYILVRLGMEIFGIFNVLVVLHGHLVYFLLNGLFIPFLYVLPNKSNKNLAANR
jgi:hypothetical protein